ncbi:hypothetical protein ACI2JN_02540 [Ochrobactrum teleogrylli]|uniref:hypothetical protein n=1 Tax=Ochrobactrum teleogrylli TaxID=2479765 RepID=UPI00385106D5
MRILDGKRNGHRAQCDQGSARHGSIEKSEMWRRIWAEMKIWAAAMEGFDDPLGELLARLERRMPFLSFGTVCLCVFVIFYGLDWIATVPPTVKLANEAFGEQVAPIVFGGIQTGHQFGAAFAAFGAGVIREQSGTNLPAFLSAGAMGVIAVGVLILSLRQRKSTKL